MAATTASTWGLPIREAAENSKLVIRSRISYRANVFHTPTKAGGKAKSAVKGLEREQNSCLKVALRAYKATAIRQRQNPSINPPTRHYLTERMISSKHRLKEDPVPRINMNIARFVVIIARQ